MSKKRKSQILVVVGLVAALVLSTYSVRAAFWQEISDVAFAPVEVCRDGIHFGLAASGPYSYDVVATLTGSTSGSDQLIDHERVTLEAVPVEDPSLSGGRSHSRFVVMPWAELLPAGTSVTFDFVPAGDAQIRLTLKWRLAIVSFRITCRFYSDPKLTVSTWQNW